MLFPCWKTDTDPVGTDTGDSFLTENVPTSTSTHILISSTTAFIEKQPILSDQSQLRIQQFS